MSRAKVLYRGADLYELRRRMTRLGWAVRWAKEDRHRPGPRGKDGFTQEQFEDLRNGLKEAERVYLLVKLGVLP